MLCLLDEGLEIDLYISDTFSRFSKEGSIIAIMDMHYSSVVPNILWKYLKCMAARSQLCCDPVERHRIRVISPLPALLLPSYYSLSPVGFLSKKLVLDLVTTNIPITTFMSTSALGACLCLCKPSPVCSTERSILHVTLTSGN